MSWQDGDNGRRQKIILHNPIQRIGIIVGEVVTLGVSLALLTAPGSEGSVASTVAATSVALAGTAFWGYFFMAGVVLQEGVLVVRSYRRFSVPVDEVWAIAAYEELRQPAVKTRDGRLIYLSPLVSPFANWCLGQRKMDALLKRLAEALGVPLLLHH